MKQKKRITALMAGLVLVGTSVFGGVSAASAVVKYPEGGTWRYGFVEPSSTIFVFSKYDHPRKKHRSTACNKRGCVRSLDMAPGKTAYIAVQATGALFGVTNRAYYYVY
ncbi:lactococcin 972 family bacteriocin [Leucobacter sp. cx-328]|uniref:lactococcin 972 family bacteriocin n=1 Tax=unclassified Leucobacter TaxID=2621730 RepID=UPI00165DBB13|nr:MULTISPECIES: lactococcin 972 family bacteriocin [unclassified Leucobacter]MBC9943553.1 lactococcin 972 family bacteriocin [Leucobacter sp. cx-328]